MVRTWKVLPLAAVLASSVLCARVDMGRAAPPVLSTPVSAGDNFALAVTAAGNVWSWGVGGSGQLGYDTTAPTSTPAEIPGLGGVIAVAAGEQFGMALRGDGSVWAWGDNAFGQLGDGTRTSRSQPEAVSSITNAVAISAAGSHALALLSDGTVWAWGDNFDGEAGNPTSSSVNTQPVQVLGLAGISQIASGNLFNLAVSQNGTLYAWGDNSYGQLGTSQGSSSNKVLPVTAVSNVTQVAAGWNHVIAMEGDGSVWTWGDDGCGELGDGAAINTVACNGGPTTIPFSSTPTQRNLGFTPLAVAASMFRSYAQAPDGTERAWGRGVEGELGDGNATNSSVPVTVAGLSTVSYAADGVEASADAYGVTSDGKLWAWGLNSLGQLGDGPTGSQANTPVQVLLSGVAQPHQVSGVANPANLQYYGGRILPASKVFAIFWFPSAHTPTDEVAYVNTVEQFLRDAGQTHTFADILPQYYQVNPDGTRTYINAATSYGGALLKTDDYPDGIAASLTPFQNGSCGTTCINDQAIQNVLRLAMSSTPGWGNADGNIYMVFTGPGESVCSNGAVFGIGAECSFNGNDENICGYHAASAEPFVYGAVVYPDTVSGCKTTVSATNDAFVDRAVETTSHELAEAITDPFGQGWCGPQGRQNIVVTDICSQAEIGDRCTGLDAQQSVGGNNYVVTELWDNRVAACAAS